MNTTQLIAVLSPVLSTALVDLQSYVAARKQNPEAKFDFVLFGIRLLIGALVGCGALVGVNAAATV